VLKEKVFLKKVAKDRIRKRIRKKISGTLECPRVFVHKSNRYLYMQAVDDQSGHILAAATSRDKDFLAKHKNSKNIESSQALGEVMAKKIIDKKITKIVFDRGLFPYHGRVKAMAEGMRKGGLVF
jgi:large subunit ribosomal protein L18